MTFPKMSQYLTAGQSSRAPTTTAALALFLIGGPILWMPVFWLTSGCAGRHAEQAVSYTLIGPLLWLIAASFPKLWVVTWIPTALAAVASAHALRALAKRHWYEATGPFIRLAISAGFCGAISGGIFELGYQMALLMDPPRISPVGSAESIAASNFDEQWSCGKHFSLFLGGLPLVTIIGAILGMILWWWVMVVGSRSRRPA